MNGINFLADTNILLYILEDYPAVKTISQNTFAVSIISEIELLGKKDISAQEKKVIKNLLDDCLMFPFNEEIKEKTITLKQQHSIKIPDAIIAATAIVFNFTLVTADKDFQKIKELKLQLMEV